MTTQTQINEANRAISAPIKKKSQIWPFILAAFLLLFLISAAGLYLQPKGEEPVRNMGALESISARYQGKADLYASGNNAGTPRALEILSSRYQGAADLYAVGKETQTQRALETLSFRYQGMADLHASGNNADTYRALEIISARYQALADLLQAQEE